MTALAWPKGWAMLDSEFFHAPMLSIRATEETVDLLRICHVAIMQQSQLTNAQMTDSENAWVFPSLSTIDNNRIVVGPRQTVSDHKGDLTTSAFAELRSCDCR